MQLVEAGLGVAVLPATVAERLARLFDVAVLELQDELAEREYRLAVREQPVLPPALQKFVDVLCPMATDPHAPPPPARQSIPSKVKTAP